MSDFLLELRSEEIPARMQAGARETLEKLFRAAMKDAGVGVGDVMVWSTPRRLALIARDLPDATEAVSEEVKGPRVGAPPQALEGFLRKTGLTADQLVDRDGVLFAVIDKPGRATIAVLAEVIPAIISAFPWPKSMRWGAASLSTESARWVRPLSGIVAIFGEELVPCEAGGVVSGYTTRGHRFHCPGEITIGGAHDYAEKLRACHVIVDHAERQDLIRSKAAEAASAAGLALVADEGLVVENAGLTEWPAPLLGRFDAEFLEVPPEVIQLTARINQKYFVCEDGAGKLANAFVCTANIAASDGGAAIVDGNRKVLAARLSDARFFWDQDRKVPLADQAKKLKRITFHEKLGTVADKVERVAKLARWLCEEGIVTETPLPEGEGPGVGGLPSRAPNTHPQPLPSREGASLADMAEQAARLCKADLVTEMVGEFPELQGLMGGYYARAEGLPDAVADAIRDHYKPVGQGDEVPTAPVTVAVSLADKLDTIAQFFVINEVPSGSKDPFALRRAGIGINRIVICNRLVSWTNSFDFLGDFAEQIVWEKYKQSILKIEKFEQHALDANKNRKVGEPDYEHDIIRRHYNLKENEVRKRDENLIHASKHYENRGKVHLFLLDRLKVQQREAGVRHDLIDAVFALGGEDDLVRLLARVHALQAFVATPDGTNLLAGYKRAANILKKEDFDAAPHDGEEDPFALVDDPDVAEVMRERTAAQNRLSYTPEPAEAALIAALDAAEPTAAAAVEAEDFAGAMAALASLRAPIDAFFDAVTVNDADPDKRRARQRLLARFRDAVHQVADFSKIEG